MASANLDTSGGEWNLPYSSLTSLQLVETRPHVKMASANLDTSGGEWNLPFHPAFLENVRL